MQSVTTFNSKAEVMKKTTPFMTLANNYANAKLKEKKTKTEYLRTFSVFVFIVDKLGSFEKVYQKFVLRVSSPNPNISKTIMPSGIHYFLGVWNNDETLALVFDILLQAPPFVTVSLN